MLLFGSSTLKKGAGVMVKDQRPMHTYPLASLPPPSGTGSCSEVRNSWVFQKLEFLQHFLCPSVAL